MLTAYIRKFLHYSGYRAWVSVTLFFFLGFTQGVGLLMIVPLLGTVGIGGMGKDPATGGISGFFSRVFAALGVPLNLFTVLAAYVLIVSLFAVLNRFQAVLDVSLQQGFIHHLRNGLYRALTYARWLFVVGRKSSDITHALTSDIQRVGSGTRFFLQFLSEIMLVIFHMGAAFLLSVPLTAATLVFGLLMMVVFRPLNRAALETGRSFREWRKTLYGTVMEHLTGMKTAKSFGLEAAHTEKMEQVNRAIEKQVVHMASIRAATRMVYEIAAVIALAAYFGAALSIPALKLPLPQVLVLVFIFTRLMPRFSSLSRSVQNIKHMLPAFEAVTELQREAEAEREYVPGTEKRTFHIENKVSFEDVRFRYSPGSSEEALKGVSFDIPARKITALSGPSGAGKSTAADVLLGLLKPDSGRITVDGSEVGEQDLPGWRNSIGYVPQEVFLFHDTLRANLLWACPDAPEQELWTALDMAAASEFVRNMSGGLDTVVGDRGTALSGGERQRIALARALLRKPVLLVLDEATSALDVGNERRVHDALKSLQDGLTVVIIAHRSSTLAIAHHIVHLDKGNAVSSR